MSARPRRAPAVALLALSLVATSARGYVFEPPYAGLRVRVERFETAGFPRVDLFFRVDSGDKQDFRYLHPANLRLTEEEVEVKEFDLQLESPALSLSLVLDDSGSIDPELRYLKVAATRFVEELHRLDEVSVVSFDRKARVLQERTTRKDLVKEGIGKLRAYGATALFDGAVLGLEAIRQGRGQRKMLMLTDGNDQTYPGGRPLSLETRDGLIRRARAEGVEIYTIALGQHANRPLLERIARETGGQAWYAPHPRHLREVFDAIARSMTARYRLSYVSPNARREKQDRTVTLDLHYQHHVGRGVGTYWLDREVPVKGLSLKRERVAGKGPGKMRLYTQGFEGQFLLVEFDLLDPATGEIVRSGRTTPDGYGRMDRPDPLLVGLKPGTYDLRVRIPGQPLRFEVPGLEVAAGETTSRRLAFSRLVFFRDGEPWYDLPHPYGLTSELLKVRIQDSLAVEERDCEGSAEECSAQPYAREEQRTLFEGRMADLKNHREVAVWLPEGIYDIQLENLFGAETMEGPSPDVLPLVETLTADNFQVLGGIELRFDVPREALAGEEDVLSPDYAAAHPDPVNPFRTEAPRTREEFERAVGQRRDRYLGGEFARDDLGKLPEERMYEYRSPEEIRARLEELSRRYEPEKSPGPDPDVDAAYLSAHGYGDEARDARRKEIEGHYLGKDRGSFPDRAGATSKYHGGPGDRFQGVEELRLRHDVEGGPERVDVRESLWDLREKVAYQEPPPEASVDALEGVDPLEPRTDADLSEVARRIRARLGREYHDFPEVPHNLDRRPTNP